MSRDIIVGSLSDEVLRKSFESEYNRVASLLYKGSISEENRAELKDIISQMKIYGVDEDIVIRITNLRKSLEQA